MRTGWRRLACLVLCVAGVEACGQALDPLEHVDPFIATAGDHGQLYPGATWPFGLVKLSPDTDRSAGRWRNAQSGYNYDQPRIVGFSHTRLGGVGCQGAGGAVLVTPRPLDQPRSDTIKRAEAASPGFYEVSFENGLRAELTVGPRMGFHRYTPPQGSGGVEMTINLGHSIGGFVDAAWHEIAPVSPESPVAFAGRVEHTNVCDHGSSLLFFAAEVDTANASLQRADEHRLTILADAGEDGTVGLRIAFSPIGVSEATSELAMDPAGGDFDTARRIVRDAWRERLSRVELSDAGPYGKRAARLLYTGLYRSMLVPQIASSSTGAYRLGTDPTRVRTLGEDDRREHHLSGWSTWDDFRKFPLLSLMAPDVLRDAALSILDLHAAGPLPAWADGRWPTPSVRHEMMPAIVLEALAKGLVTADEVRVASEPLSQARHGNHLERAYASWVVGRTKRLLGDHDAAAEAMRDALAYRDNWVADQRDDTGARVGFFLPDGRPTDPAASDAVDAHYYEGNLWHYRWWVPHDIAGLIELDGGDDRFAAVLERYFEEDRHMVLNEPPLAYPYLFIYAGKPWLTQRWSRRFAIEPVTQRYHNHGRFDEPVVRPVYMDEPAGWLPSMDDDTGAMSAHFVQSAIGLYSACPGELVYLIGSPIFPELTVRPNGPDGPAFTIEARGVSREAVYVDSATLNGRPINRAWLTHDEILAGGRLVLVMSETPGSDWAASPYSRPPSLSR